MAKEKQTQQEPQEEQTFDSPQEEKADSAYEIDALAMAEQEIEELTPEAYLEMKQFIESVEGQYNLPEAAAVAATTVYGKHGGYIYLSQRSVDIIDAIKSLHQGVKYAATMGLHPGAEKGKQQQATIQPAPTTASTATPVPAQQTAQPSPTTAVVDTNNIEVVSVNSVQHRVSPSGHHQLNVKGGKWTQYGFPAWEEVVTAAGVDINQFALGPEFQPPPELALAWIDMIKKKVVKFAPST